MKKLFLMKNPDLFQGEQYLNTNTNYFEGWYFKNVNGERGISFIPGIHISDTAKNAFIQVITNDSSYYVPYSISDFAFSFDPFCITIGKNTFTKEGLHIEIEDKKQKLHVLGDIFYFDSKNIKPRFLAPNIMGPFSYIPFMECNHAILSMQNKINGFIKINGNLLDFEHGTGYIEKDWGSSFPKSYIWCQGNCFKKDASFMLSIADIPFQLFHFRGFICVLMIDNQEFQFTTYNHAKIEKYYVDDSLLDIILEKGCYFLHVQSEYENGMKLMAPVKGKMEKDILESITTFVTVTLKKDDEIIFSDTSSNCGLEIVLS